MKFETKYDIGEKVIIITDNKIFNGKIESITILCNFEIVYRISVKKGPREIGEFVNRTEHQIFSTKEDLIDCIKNNL